MRHDSLRILSLNTEHDISKKKDGSIMKLILNKGDDESDCPRFGACCTVRLSKLPFMHTDEIEFTIGEGCEHAIIYPIEYSLYKFKKGERSQLRLNTPSTLKSTVSEESAFIVELVSFTQVPGHWQLTCIGECIALAEQFKIRGTEFFKTGNLSLAKKYYKKALLYLQNIDLSCYDGSSWREVESLNVNSHINTAEFDSEGRMEKEVIDKLNDSIKRDGLLNSKPHLNNFMAHLQFEGHLNDTQLKEIQQRPMVHRLWLIHLLHLNLAQCYLKLGKNLSALDACDKALEINCRSDKGFYRRAMAHLAMENFELAVEDLSVVHNMDKNNKAVVAELQKSKQLLSEYKEKEKAVFDGMFTKFALYDLAKEKLRNAPCSDVFSDMGEWSNDLAVGMMTLEQEMAAFGEEMPPKLKYDNISDYKDVDSDCD